MSAKEKLSRYRTAYQSGDLERSIEILDSIQAEEPRGSLY